MFFGPWKLPKFLTRGNNQGGFGVTAVLPTSGTQTFIKNYHFLFHGSDAVPTYPGVNHPLHLRDIRRAPGDILLQDLTAGLGGVRWGGGGGPIQELETKERVFSHFFFFFIKSHL